MYPESYVEFIPDYQKVRYSLGLILSIKSYRGNITWLALPIMPYQSQIIYRQAKTLQTASPDCGGKDLYGYTNPNSLKMLSMDLRLELSIALIWIILLGLRQRSGLIFCGS